MPEFVAFGCRGSDDKQDLAGFNLKGEEMWQQNIYEMPYVSPLFAFAPAAGRFALARTLVSSPIELDSPLPSTLVVSQEVRVYQTYTGKQVFRIDLTPVERSGQNFALSPDGMRLAAIREVQVRHAGTKDYDAYTQLEAGVEVYSLPALSDGDQAALTKMEAMAPQDAGARIDLALERVSSADASSVNAGRRCGCFGDGTGDSRGKRGPRACACSGNLIGNRISD